MAAFDPAYFRSQAWWRDETLRDWLDRCIASAPSRAAILTLNERLDYLVFSEHVRSFAAGLLEAGIEHGDVVAVHLPNIPEFLISWLAINRIGAVMQTVHTPYGLRELEHLIAHSGAKACIAMARQKDRSPARVWTQINHSQ